MMNLLKYEFQKFIYNKKNFVVLIALITFLVGFITYNNYLDQQYPTMMSNQLTDIADFSNKTSRGLDASITISPEGKQKEALKEQKKFWHNLESSSLLLVNGYQSNSYQNMEFIQFEITWNEVLLDGINNDYDLTNVSKDSAKTIQDKIAKNQYIIDNNIEISHSPYECNFFNLFNLIFESFPTLILTFIFLLLVFDTSTSEFENGSYKIMYSGKDSIAKILLIKAMFSFILIIFYLLLIIGFFALAGLFFSFGSPSYPYPVNPSIFPIKNIVLIMMLLYFMALLVLSGIVLLVSYVTYSSSMTLVGMITTYMMIVVFQQIFDFQWLYSYIPVCYPFVREIIQAHGTMICIGIGSVAYIALVVISINYMKRKDILV